MEANCTANGAPEKSAPAAAVLAQMTGAEKKKQAKAEKAARREKERQQKENTGGAIGQRSGKDVQAQGGKVVTQPTKSEQKGLQILAKDSIKPQHKRTASNAAEAQKPLLAKGVPPHPPSLDTTSGNQEVALFSHLYGQPRRKTVEGAGKEVHPAVLALGLQMSSYVICGSNARCMATLLVFKRVIETYTTPPSNTLTRHLTPHYLSPQIDYLKSCRPLSISMGNAIRWLKLEISKVDPDTPEAEAKTQLCNSIDNFIRERITLAGTAIAESAIDKIIEGDVILTYAKSSIVEKTLLMAHRRGTKFRTIVVDSKPLFEGRQLARGLADAGLEVRYSLVHAISHVIKDATKVFLGAHAMMSNGRLFSRIGTAMVAMMAHELDVPVIVCCESVKFTEKVALDSIVVNEVASPDELVVSAPSANVTSTSAVESLSSPLLKWRETPNLRLLNLMYDVTPAEYIKMVVTELGSLPPSSVPVVYRLSTNT
ncbi:MAG: hypothetical protein M1836_003854 [Candelina mexicana]|nr:MAG: hypothetical protein M1836_003854 [Candelina mexicana]